MGEGAAALVLETEEHALARGARIYAELAGGAVTSDSYHITAPDPEGSARGPRDDRAPSSRPARRVDDVTHINAHATSTPVGDIAEYKALRARVRRPRRTSIPVSATKASTGHLLGGTGALEAIFTILALHERVGPADDQHHRAGPGDPARRRHGAPQPLGDGAAARDQQLVRLRRPQRRRRVPLRV